MTSPQTSKDAMSTPSPRQGGRGISEHDVWAAADALLMAGQRPTIERIRQQLGRGSPNTVSPYLDAWFAGLGARVQGAAHPSAGWPDGVPMSAPVASAAHDLWRLALQEGRAALAEEEAARRAVLDAREAALAADREALEQSRAVLHERIAAAETAAADARQAKEEAQAQARRAEALLIEAQADAVASRQALSVARDATQALQDAHAAQRSQWDAERVRLGERAEASERRLMLELDAARESIKALQQAGKQAQRQLQEAESGLAAMAEAQHRCARPRRCRIASSPACASKSVPSKRSRRRISRCWPHRSHRCPRSGGAACRAESVARPRRSRRLRRCCAVCAGLEGATHVFDSFAFVTTCGDRRAWRRSIAFA